MRGGGALLSLLVLPLYVPVLSPAGSTTAMSARLPTSIAFLIDEAWSPFFVLLVVSTATLPAAVDFMTKPARLVGCGAPAPCL